MDLPSRQARCVVGLLPGQLEGVQVSLGDIHSYGMISHLFFSCACNASLAAHVSIQDDEKRRWRPNSQTALKGQRGHGPTTATLGSSRAPRVAPFKHTSEDILSSWRAGSPPSQVVPCKCSPRFPRAGRREQALDFPTLTCVKLKKIIPLVSRTYRLFHARLVSIASCSRFLLRPTHPVEKDLARYSPE